MKVEIFMEVVEIKAIDVLGIFLSDMAIAQPFLASTRYNVYYLFIDVLCSIIGMEI